jgi:hypothetical protein
MPASPDGQHADNYTIVLLVTPDTGGDQRSEWEGAGVGGGGSWVRVKMHGMHGWSNDDRYGRKYFRDGGGGYCCLSAEPVTILSDGKVSITVVGSARGDTVYRLILRTLRVAQSSPN